MIKTVASISVFFEKDAVRTTGRIHLRLLDARSDGVLPAEVSFEGVELAPVVAMGRDALDALTDALRRGTHALDDFRASGGRVLEELRDSRVEPLEQSLEQRFRATLERFGFDEEPCEIVAGPTPDASGNVAFTVRLGDRLIETFASPCGIGVPAGEDSDSAAAVMRVVSAFQEEHRDEMVALYREAARLRRAAGNPPRFGLSRKSGIVVVGEPVANRGFVTFRVRGAAADQEVLVFADGGVMDDCDNGYALVDGDREAACAAALEYVFSNRQEMTSLGLDVDRLTELYR